MNKTNSLQPAFDADEKTVIGWIRAHLGRDDMPVPYWVTAKLNDKKWCKENKDHFPEQGPNRHERRRRAKMFR